jgi:hypothetical protein
MSRRLIFLAVVGLLMLGLSACGGSESLSGRPGMLYFYSDI